MGEASSLSGFIAVTVGNLQNSYARSELLPKCDENDDRHLHFRCRCIFIYS